MREKRSDMSQKIPRYLDVAVPLPLRTPLTYRIPESKQGCAEPGARAIVPVGRRLLTGFIIASRTEPPVAPDRVKDVADLPDTTPVITSEILALALWAARYYVAPPGSMLAAAMPPGTGRRSQVRVRRRASGAAGAPSASEKRALASIPESRTVDLRGLGLSSAMARKLEAKGLIDLETVLGGPRVGARHARQVRLALSLEKAMKLCSRAPRQRAIVQLLDSNPRKQALMTDIVDHQHNRPRLPLKPIYTHQMVQFDRTAP